ncbi:MAG: domain containing protein [Pedosphaera sp.]|nr:domain containing protein [Pedosphaera sp.]
MRRLRYIGFLFALGIAACLLLLVMRRQEPRYQNRTLSSWLQQYEDTALDHPQQLAEAEAAVRAIGAGRALPHLLRMIKAHDGPLRSWVIQHNEKWEIRYLKLKEAQDTQQLGIIGFRLLGTNASPAVGELTKLLEDREHAFVSIRCLKCVGKAAESALCQGLTNQDWPVRQLSVSVLAGVTDGVDVYMARIKGCFKDPSEQVRDQVVVCIGAQTEAPETAVPLLIAALQDPSEQVNARAASLLAGFGTNALSAFPALSNLVENGSARVAVPAMKTLVAIAPSDSLPVLIDAAKRGRPYDALQVLIGVAPDKALPILMRNLQSPVPRLRNGAVAGLCSYPVKTPEIQAAIELATIDTAPMVSSLARSFLQEQFLKAHPDGLVFPGEPSFKGKRLGEWLKMREEPDGSFPKEAEEALRAMGTNAIPALLAQLAYRLPPANIVIYEVNFNAVRGFITLGEQAKPVLPRLRALMDSKDKNIALHAMLATLGMGPDSIPCLIKGLTNQFADVRNEAANYLSQGIGKLSPEQRKQVVPLFVKLLDDPDESVRMNATNALKEIDPAAAAKSGLK